MSKKTGGLYSPAFFSILLGGIWRIGTTLPARSMRTHMIPTALVAVAAVACGSGTIQPTTKAPIEGVYDAVTANGQPLPIAQSLGDGCSRAGHAATITLQTNTSFTANYSYRDQCPSPRAFDKTYLGAVSGHYSPSGSDLVLVADSGAKGIALPVSGTVSDSTLTLRGTVNGLPITVKAQRRVGANVGAPAQLHLITPPSANARALHPLDVQPLIQVLDLTRLPAKSSATVTASVADLYGKVCAFVAGGASAAADASGKIGFSALVLGSSSTCTGGPVTILFSSPGLASTNAKVQLTCDGQAITTGPSVSTSISTGDCHYGGVTPGRLGKYLSFLGNTSGATAIQVTETAAARPAIFFKGPNAGDKPIGSAASTSGLSVSQKLLVPPGTSYLIPTFFDTLARGSVTVQVSPAPEDASNCEDVIIATPLVTSQHLAITDCLAADTTYRGDSFRLLLPAWAQLKATVSSSTLPCLVELDQLQPKFTFLARTNCTNGTATASYTNDSGTGVYEVWVGANTPHPSGAYILSVTIAFPTAARPGLASSADLVSRRQNQYRANASTARRRGVSPRDGGRSGSSFEPE